MKVLEKSEVIKEACVKSKLGIEAAFICRLRAVTVRTLKLQRQLVGLSIGLCRVSLSVCVCVCVEFVF